MGWSSNVAPPSRGSARQSGRPGQPCGHESLATWHGMACMIMARSGCAGRHAGSHAMRVGRGRVLGLQSYTAGRSKRGVIAPRPLHALRPSPLCVPPPLPRTGHPAACPAPCIHSLSGLGVYALGFRPWGSGHLPPASPPTLPPQSPNEVSHFWILGFSRTSSCSSASTCSSACRHAGDRCSRERRRQSCT